jgi:hypothetical protein
VTGSCSVQVSFVKHPADWDVEGYIRQHPVMQQHQQAVQAPPSAAGSTSNTMSLGSFGATLTRAANGNKLTELPILSIIKQKCGGAPHAVILQERVRCCVCQFLCHLLPHATCWAV